VYIHRTGRTARAGKSGVAISIIHSREIRKMRDIEKLLNKKFEQKKVPTGVEICEKQLFNLVDRVEKVEVDEAQIEQFLPVILKKLDWLSREDLIKHFVSEEFNRILAYYKNTPDLNADHPEEGRKRAPKEQFLTFRINAGFQDGLNPPRLIGLINEQTRNRNIEVGRIEIGQNDSFFEIDKDFKDVVLTSFKDAIFEGVRVSVKISESLPKARSKSRSYDKPNYKSDARPKFRSGDRPKYKSDDRPKYKSDDRPKYKSDDRPKHKTDDSSGYKPKAWESDLSTDWSKSKSKDKSKDWSKDKSRGKSNDKPRESYGGKKNKRSPYKNW